MQKYLLNHRLPKGVKIYHKYFYDISEDKLMEFQNIYKHLLLVSHDELNSKMQYWTINVQVKIFK